MNKFLLCFGYLVITSVISFFLGRLLPKKWFTPEYFPYRAFSFEKSGKLYEKLKIRHWQNKVPDMSKIFPSLMPAKNLSGDYKNRLPVMIKETCVAEMIHGLNCLLGLHCLSLYPGIGGVIIVLIYIIVFNLPYILIQRYNRPRLQKLQKRFSEAEYEQKRGEMKTCEC